MVPIRDRVQLEVPAVGETARRAAAARAGAEHGLASKPSLDAMALVPVAIRPPEST